MPGHLLDDVAEAHHVIRHGEGIGKAQINLLLARRGLMVRELHGDAHTLQGADGIGAEVRRLVRHCLIEVPTNIGGHRRLAVGIGGMHQEELDLRVNVAGETHFGGNVHLSTQNLSRIRPRRLAIGHGDIAEHAGGEAAVSIRGERQDLERAGVWLGDGVRFGHTREALDGRAIKADSLGKSTL